MLFPETSIQAATSYATTVVQVAAAAFSGFGRERHRPAARFGYTARATESNRLSHT